MHKLPMGDIKALNLNRYEAIIIASKHARNLNNRRLQTLEQMTENPDLDIDPRKLTMIALKDLLEGRVKYVRTESL